MTPPTDRSTLVAFSDQLADAVAGGARSTVAVHGRLRLPSTGIHWRDGVVVPTEATVRRDSDLSVTLPDGRHIPATLAGRDPGTDLAALRIPAGELPVAEFGDPARLRPGHLVLALARLGDGGPRAAFGAVSATGGAWRCWKGGQVDLLLQSDLTLYPGFGGGPLVDAGGLVLGINSGGLSRPLATPTPPPHDPDDDGGPRPQAAPRSRLRRPGLAGRGDAARPLRRRRARSAGPRADGGPGAALGRAGPPSARAAQIG